MSEDIKHHINIYWSVFIGLLILTIVTVGASYIHFPYAWLGLFVGLLIACVKGFLVASQFMHLNNEKKWIYGVLILTVVFFFVLLFMPLMWDVNNIGYGNGVIIGLNNAKGDYVGYSVGDGQISSIDVFRVYSNALNNNLAFDIHYQHVADEIDVDGEILLTKAEGDGPVDATFNAIKDLVPHDARLQLYQVNAVTEGTDAQAEVTVRLEENGKTVNGQGADTDTMVASARAYVNALNKLLVKRTKTAPGALSA